MQISIQINGLEEALKRLDDMPRAISKGMSDAIKKSAFLIEGQAKQNAPVDTGRLRSSIYSTFSGLTATISPLVNYAIFVHEGTRYLRARPFLYDAVEQTKEEISGIFSSEISKLI